MCQCDCLNKFLILSAKQKEIETDLEKTLKKFTDLNLSEFYVVYYLSQEPNLRMRIYDLQDKVGLTQSAMSRLVARMEKREGRYIYRGDCPKDKRGVCIVLSDEGKAFVEANIAAVTEVIKKYDDFLCQFKLA